MTASEIAVLVAAVVASLLGGGGLVAFYQAKKVSDLGEAEVEIKARAAATADWLSVKEYWEKEIDNLRKSAKELGEKHEKELAELRGQMLALQRERDIEREADRQYILELESHIWLNKPAPPPARRPIRTE